MSRLKIILFLIILISIGVVALIGLGESGQKSVERTRQELRQAGFKTDLADFDFSTSPEMQERECYLSNANEDGWWLDHPPYSAFDFMPVAGSNAAVVVWEHDWILTSPSPDAELYWAWFHSAADGRINEVLEDVCAAALAGPIRFNLQAPRGYEAAEGVVDVAFLIRKLNLRTMVAMHDGHTTTAWTNFMAATRLVTAWEPGPAEPVQIRRLSCIPLMFDATWQMLQSKSWTDGQLAQLQREWESVSFLAGLPETAAFRRACAVDFCEQQRQAPQADVSWLRNMLEVGIHQPGYLWSELINLWQARKYRHQGIYDDEKDLLLFHRDTELAFRSITNATSWLEMRSRPGVTNPPVFKSRHSYSFVETILEDREMGVHIAMNQRGQTFPGFVAEAEAQRRILVTAIALGRYRLRTGKYPRTLQEMGGDLLKQPAIDFMDGQPLRYKPTEDGHFVLYSVGLDGVDNGGKMKPRILDEKNLNAEVEDRDQHLVWPRPANEAESEATHEAEEKVRDQAIVESEDTKTKSQWEDSARLQREVEGILAAKEKPPAPEPLVHGVRIGELLRNEVSCGTNHPSIYELLTLKQVKGSDDPETATFELPLAYDALTNIGELYLCLDSREGMNDNQAVWSGVQRATNGDCLVTWNTIFECAGKHALQLALAIQVSREDGNIKGPVASYVVTNPCQFSLMSATFSKYRGASLHGRLDEARADYAIELSTTNGDLIKTITGSTTNGVIKERWDLLDNNGRHWSNDFFNSVFHLKFPESGRSQTMRGP